jgi:acyl-coenzyme A thioesterase PaaI-like protein
MKLSAWQVKWMLRIFPAWLFSRVWVKSMRADFKNCTVSVKPSILNRNLQRTIFGGTIFSAFDPWFPLMFWQVFAHRGQKLEAWLKSAEIDYKQPAASRLTIHFTITDTDLAEAEASLAAEGRFQKWMTAEAINTAGEVCAEARLLLYIRNYKGHSANF